MAVDARLRVDDATHFFERIDAERVYAEQLAGVVRLDVAIAKLWAEAAPKAGSADRSVAPTLISIL